MARREVAITDDIARHLLGDRELSGLWEQLRRTKRAMTARQLADASRLGLAAVQRHLDRMEELTLAERLPTSSRRRQVSYRVTATDLVIRYRSPQDHALVAEAVAAHTTLAQRVAETHAMEAADAAAGAAVDATPDGWFGRYAAVVALTESEAAEMRRRLQAVADYLHGLRLRPPARNEVAPLANHTVTVRCTRIEPRVLPMPTLRFVPDGAPVPRAASGGAAAGGRPLLSAREQQVAAAYARGLTRAQVAEELGLSQNSVATFTKRLYKKLGIRRRGTLATRLNEVLGDDGASRTSSTGAPPPPPMNFDV